MSAIDELPNELIYLITSNLPTILKFACISVNKRFNVYSDRELKVMGTKMLRRAQYPIFENLVLYPILTNKIGHDTVLLTADILKDGLSRDYSICRCWFPNCVDPKQGFCIFKRCEHRQVCRAHAKTYANGIRVLRTGNKISLMRQTSNVQHVQHVHVFGIGDFNYSPLICTNCFDYYYDLMISCTEIGDMSILRKFVDVESRSKDILNNF